MHAGDDRRGDHRDRGRGDVDDRDRKDQRADPGAARDPHRLGNPRGLAMCAQGDQRRADLRRDEHDGDDRRTDDAGGLAGELVVADQQAAGRARKDGEAGTADQRIAGAPAQRPQVDRAQRLTVAPPRREPGADAGGTPARQRDGHRGGGQHDGRAHRALAQQPQQRPRELEDDQRECGDQPCRAGIAGQAAEVRGGRGADDHARGRHEHEQPDRAEHQSDPRIVESQPGQIRCPHGGGTEHDRRDDPAAERGGSRAARGGDDHRPRPDLDPAHPPAGPGLREAR
jgi:hypothetical protein